jgi:DNA-binding transcriptional regulator YbjK
VRERGKLSREALLDAAILLIARDGLDAVSHRAVAREAEASPALTTYYFESKTDLIAQAFQHFVERGAPGISEVWARAHAILDRVEAGLSRAKGAERLAELAAGFVCLNPRPQPDGVAFELAFLYQPRLEPELARIVRAYRERIIAPAVKFCARAGSAAPQEDAALLIGAILRLEFEQIAVAARTPRTAVKAQLQRLIGMIMGARA